jgi:hypothetical protein
VAEGEELIMESIESLYERLVDKQREATSFLNVAELYRADAMRAAADRNTEALALYCDAQASSFKSAALCAFQVRSLQSSITLTKRVQALEAKVAGD